MAAQVVAVGDCSVDRFHTVGEGIGSGRLEELAATYDWFPAEGESRGIDRETFEGTLGGTLRGLEWDRHYGGKAANQAAAAERAGAAAAFYGRVGENAAPLVDLRERGVDTSNAERVAAPTTVAYVFVDDGTTRNVGVYSPAVLVDRAYVDGHLEGLAAAEVLLLADVFDREAQRRLLDELDDLTVVYDPGVETPPDILEHPGVDYLTPNVREAAGLDAGAVAGTVIETTADGARAPGVTAAAPSVDAVDPTGAGDAFNGTLAAHLAGGADLGAAMDRAVQRASVACTHEGARPPEAD